MTFEDILSAGAVFYDVDADQDHNTGSDGLGRTDHLLRDQKLYGSQQMGVFTGGMWGIKAE